LEKEVFLNIGLQFQMALTPFVEIFGTADFEFKKIVLKV